MLQKAFADRSTGGTTRLERVALIGFRQFRLPGDQDQRLREIVRPEPLQEQLPRQIDDVNRQQKPPVKSHP